MCYYIRRLTDIHHKDEWRDWIGRRFTKRRGRAGKVSNLFFIIVHCCYTRYINIFWWIFRVLLSFYEFTRNILLAKNKSFVSLPFNTEIQHILILIYYRNAYIRIAQVFMKKVHFQVINGHVPCKLFKRGSKKLKVFTQIQTILQLRLCFSNTPTQVRILLICRLEINVRRGVELAPLILK